MGMEESLETLNKSAIGAIQDESTDLFDCIDIHKQPAFDHPLLKNHKVQVKPSWSPKDFIGKYSSHDKRPGLILETVDCPKGTVPTRRIRKEDLIRAERAQPIYPLTDDYPGQHFAVVGIENETETKYYGASAIMNAINPTIVDEQASLSMIWIFSGYKDTLYQMNAGWAVYPRLYGDTKTHLFSYWMGAKKGCFNLLCPGFVHVSENVPVDAIIKNTSIYDVLQFEMEVLIALDKATDNWWLTFPRLNFSLGYWPGSLFPNLEKGASNVGFGGLAIAPVHKTSPPMGFAKFPEGNLLRSGYFAQMQVVTPDNQKLGLVGDNWKQIVDCRTSYGVKYYGDLKGDNGYLMEYGGPGGICGN